MKLLKKDIEVMHKFKTFEKLRDFFVNACHWALLELHLSEHETRAGIVYDVYNLRGKEEGYIIIDRRDHWEYCRIKE